MRERSGRAQPVYSPATRCYLFHGPDDACSRALATQVLAAIAPDVEQVDLGAARLRGEAGLLADEAASRSLFGTARCIRVDGVGDESLEAVELLFAAETAGDPVILIAGALRKDSRLVAFLERQPNAVVRASRLPDAGELAAIAVRTAGQLGLGFDDEVAHRLVEVSGGDRAVLESEIVKLADYADASADAPARASIAMVEAIVGRQGESDTDDLVRAVFAGDLRGLAGRLAQSGPEDAVPLVRAIQRRVLAMAACRAEMDRGATPQSAVDRAGRAIFWRDRGDVARDIARWPSSRLALAVDRLASLERGLKSSRGPGHLGAEQLYHALARSVRR